MRSTCRFKALEAAGSLLVGFQGVFAEVDVAIQEFL